MPVRPRLVRISGTLPVFVNVAVKTVELLPSATLPKVKEGGLVGGEVVKVAIAPVPAPVRVTV